MVDLAPDTEALVRRLAKVRHVSIDEAVRQAVVEALPAPSVDIVLQDLAARRLARFGEFAQHVATLPPLDRRPSREIMDDLDPL